MLKRITFGLLILFVGLSLVGGEVSASDQVGPKALTDHTNKVAIVGEVVDATADGFQVLSLQGELFDVEHSDGLKIRWRPMGEASFEDVSVGGWVIVSFLNSPGMESMPSQIILLGEDFDPASFKAFRFEGTVAAVDLQDGLFDLLVDADMKGFFVDHRTRFLGDLTSLEDLTEEMLLSVLAFEEDDGTWRALSILNDTSMDDSEEEIEEPTDGESNGEEPKPENPFGKKIDVGGRVTAIGADSLTIQTKGGTPMTFAVGPDTIFNSQVGSHSGLGDLQVNFLVVVVYYEDAMLNGLREAYRVVVANEGIGFNLNKQGWVDSVSADQFTMTTNQGDSYTFMVNGSTGVKGVGSFSEIAAGMRVFVYYADNGGSLVAKGIQVWP